jgi:Arc/MetJ family transcription regulator
MRTPLDMDRELLDRVDQITGESSPSKAVSLALKEFVRRKKLKELRQLLGTRDIEDNWRELERTELEYMRRYQS